MRESSDDQQVGVDSKPGSNRTRRIAIAVTIVTVSAVTIGIGAYATFTDTQTATPQVDSGTVTLAPISVSAPNNRLSIGATDVAAGDTIERAVNIKNVGTIALSTVTLTTDATTSSALDTDVTNGLQLQIDLCDQAWTEAGAGPPYTYTCGGTTSTVLTTAPVIGTTMALANLDLTAGTDNFARVTMTLPTGADNTFQDLSSVIDFSFTATQRAGMSK